MSWHDHEAKIAELERARWSLESKIGDREREIGDREREIRHLTERYDLKIAELEERISNLETAATQ